MTSAVLALFLVVAVLHLGEGPAGGDPIEESNGDTSFASFAISNLNLLEDDEPKAASKPVGPVLVGGEDEALEEMEDQLLQTPAAGVNKAKGVQIGGSLMQPKVAEADMLLGDEQDKASAGDMAADVSAAAVNDIFTQQAVRPLKAKVNGGGVAKLHGMIELNNQAAAFAESFDKPKVKKAPAPVAKKPVSKPTSREMKEKPKPNLLAMSHNILSAVKKHEPEDGDDDEAAPKPLAHDEFMDRLSTFQKAVRSRSKLQMSLATEEQKEEWKKEGDDVRKKAATAASKRHGLKHAKRKMAKALAAHTKKQAEDGEAESLPYKADATKRKMEQASMKTFRAHMKNVWSALNQQAPLRPSTESLHPLGAPSPKKLAAMKAKAKKVVKPKKAKVYQHQPDPRLSLLGGAAKPHRKMDARKMAMELFNDNSEDVFNTNAKGVAEHGFLGLKMKKQSEIEKEKKEKKMTLMDFLSVKNAPGLYKSTKKHVKKVKPTQVVAKVLQSVAAPKAKPQKRKPRSFESEFGSTVKDILHEPATPPELQRRRPELKAKAKKKDAPGTVSWNDLAGALSKRYKKKKSSPPKVVVSSFEAAKPATLEGLDQFLNTGKVPTPKPVQAKRQPAVHHYRKHHYRKPTPPKAMKATQKSDEDVLGLLGLKETSSKPHRTVNEILKHKKPQATRKHKTEAWEAVPKYARKFQKKMDVFDARQAMEKSLQNADQAAQHSVERADATLVPRHLDAHTSMKDRMKMMAIDLEEAQHEDVVRRREKAKVQAELQRQKAIDAKERLRKEHASFVRAQQVVQKQLQKQKQDAIKVQAQIETDTEKSVGDVFANVFDDSWSQVAGKLGQNIPKASELAP